MGTSSRIPEGYHQILPHLVVRDAVAAIDYYRRAFGAKQVTCLPGPDGKTVMHAEIQIGDSRVFLNDEFPAYGALSPLAYQGTPVTIHLWVEDVDAVFAQAVAAGGTVIMPVADQFWGDRYGVLKDPFGHQWSIASHMRDMTPEELEQAAADAFRDRG